jgi:hypothetical protein|tara:strand:- start:7589 stop:7951 length:363 start_codon:yes stop_codon:yes gene_type:complete
MEDLHLCIDEVTPSQNPWERMHWTKRSEARDFWFWLVREAAGTRPAERSKKRVRIVRIAKRLIDDQNVPAGCKYLVDALQTYGHIYRDSRTWTRITFDQRKCGSDEKPHMEVTVTEWAGD